MLSVAVSHKGCICFALDTRSKSGLMQGIPHSVAPHGSLSPCKARAGSPQPLQHSTQDNLGPWSGDPGEQVGNPMIRNLRVTLERLSDPLKSYTYHHRLLRPNASAAMGKTLVVFDFDWSFVDQDTDRWVFEVLSTKLRRLLEGRKEGGSQCTPDVV